MGTIKIKRIYDEASEDDGYRVLVDRLWPRGVSKTDAKIDAWNKDLAPSTELRKWFDHKAERFDEFSTRYRGELLLKEDELEKLRDMARLETITLLYGAKDPNLNQAIVLQKLLLKGL